MKDIKERRNSKVVKFSRKKSTEKSKVMEILEFVVAFVAVVVVAYCYHKITFHNSYDWGSIEGKRTDPVPSEYEIFFNVTFD